MITPEILPDGSREEVPLGPPENPAMARIRNEIATTARQIGDIQGPDHEALLKTLSNKRRNAVAIGEPGAREMHLTEENLSKRCVYLAIEAGGKPGWYAVTDTFGDLINLTDGESSTTQLSVDELLAINGEDIVVINDIATEKLARPATPARREAPKETFIGPKRIAQTEVRGPNLEPGQTIIVEDFNVGKGEAPFSGRLTVQDIRVEVPNVLSIDAQRAGTKQIVVLSGTDDNGRSVVIEKPLGLLSNARYRLAS